MKTKFGKAMSEALRNAEVGVPCPGCGHQTPQTLAWLEAHDEMACAGCGGVVQLKDAGLREGLQRALGSAEDFGKSLERSRKRLK